MDTLIPMCWDGERQDFCPVKYEATWWSGKRGLRRILSPGQVGFGKSAATVRLLVLQVHRLKVNSHSHRHPQEEKPFTHGFETQGAWTTMDPRWAPIPADFNIGHTTQ